MSDERGWYQGGDERDPEGGDKSEAYRAWQRQQQLQRPWDRQQPWQQEAATDPAAGADPWSRPQAGPRHPDTGAPGAAPGGPVRREDDFRPVYSREQSGSYQPPPQSTQPGPMPPAPPPAPMQPPPMQPVPPGGRPMPRPNLPQQSRPPAALPPAPSGYPGPGQPLGQIPAQGGFGRSEPPPGGAPFEPAQHSDGPPLPTRSRHAAPQAPGGEPPAGPRYGTPPNGTELPRIADPTRQGAGPGRAPGGPSTGQVPTLGGQGPDMGRAPDPPRGREMYGDSMPRPRQHPDDPRADPRGADPRGMDPRAGGAMRDGAARDGGLREGGPRTGEFGRDAYGSEKYGFNPHGSSATRVDAPTSTTYSSSSATGTSPRPSRLEANRAARAADSAQSARETELDEVGGRGRGGTSGHGRKSSGGGNRKLAIAGGSVGVVALALIAYLVTRPSGSPSTPTADATTSQGPTAPATSAPASPGPSAAGAGQASASASTAASAGASATSTGTGTGAVGNPANVNVARVHVQVFNGSGVDQRAAMIKNALVTHGFALATVAGNATATSARTTVFYPASRGDSAAAVAKALAVPNANITLSTMYTEVTVVIGTDWKTGNTYPTA